MKILRIRFEGYLSNPGRFTTCFLLLRESMYSVSEVYRIAEREGIKICSELHIDQLIEDRCREEGGVFWKAYQTAAEQSYFLQTFPVVGSVSENCFRIPRFSESDFEQIITSLGGHKIPKTTYKTPDFLLDNIALELKDIQEEGLYDRERQQALGNLFADIDSRTINLDLRIDYGLPTNGYHRLIANKIQKVIVKAAKQIKSLQQYQSLESGGVILLNTGMYSLPHELLKKMVSDTIIRNTKTIEFVIVFSQIMQTNGFDATALFYCDLIGNCPPQSETIRKQVYELVNDKMTQMVISNNLETYLSSQAPISFLSSNKIFYWNPGIMRDSRF